MPKHSLGTSQQQQASLPLNISDKKELSEMIAEVVLSANLKPHNAGAAMPRDQYIPITNLLEELSEEDPAYLLTLDLTKIILYDLLLLLYSEKTIALSYTGKGGQKITLTIDAQDDEKYEYYCNLAALSNSGFALQKINTDIKKILDQEKVAPKALNKAKLLSYKYKKFDVIVEYYLKNKSPAECLDFFQVLLSLDLTKNQRGDLLYLKGVTQKKNHNLAGALRSFEESYNHNKTIASGLELVEHLMKQGDTGIQYELLKDIKEEVQKTYDKKHDYDIFKSIFYIEKIISLYNFFISYHLHGDSAKEDFTKNTAIDLYKSLSSILEVNHGDSLEYFQTRCNFETLSYENNPENSLKNIADLIKRFKDLEITKAEPEIQKFIARTALFVAKKYEEKVAASQATKDPTQKVAGPDLNSINSLQYYKIASQIAQTPDAIEATTFLAKCYDLGNLGLKKNSRIAIDYYIKLASMLQKLEINQPLKEQTITRIKDLLTEGILPNGFNPTDLDGDEAQQQKHMLNFYEAATELKITEANFVYAQYLHKNLPFANSEKYYKLAAQKNCSFSQDALEALQILEYQLNSQSFFGESDSDPSPISAAAPSKATPSKKAAASNGAPHAETAGYFSNLIGITKKLEEKLLEDIDEDAKMQIKQEILDILANGIISSESLKKPRSSTEKENKNLVKKIITQYIEAGLIPQEASASAPTETGLLHNLAKRSLGAAILALRNIDKLELQKAGEELGKSRTHEAEEENKKIRGLEIQQQRQQMELFLSGTRQLESFSDVPQFLQEIFREILSSQNENNIDITLKGSAVYQKSRTREPQDLDIAIKIAGMHLWSDEQIKNFVQTKFNLDPKNVTIFNKFNIFTVNAKDEFRRVDFSFYSDQKLPASNLSWTNSVEEEIGINKDGKLEKTPPAALIKGLMERNSIEKEAAIKFARENFIINPHAHKLISRLCFLATISEISEESLQKSCDDLAILSLFARELKVSCQSSPEDFQKAIAGATNSHNLNDELKLNFLRNMQNITANYYKKNASSIDSDSDRRKFFDLLNDAIAQQITLRATQQAQPNPSSPSAAQATLPSSCKASPTKP